MAIFDRLRSQKSIAKRNLKKTLKKYYKQTIERSEIIQKSPVTKNRQFSAYYPGFYSNSAYSGSDSGGAKWPFGLSASGRSRIIDHYALRQNARDLFHESLDARGIIERFSDSIVDVGLKLESMPDYETLKITPEQAEEWASRTERAFHLWSKDKKQHRSGTMSFYQMQGLYMTSQQRDNDNFTRLYYSAKKTLQNPLQFEMIDPNQIRGNEYTSTYAQYNHDDGIIRNADGTEKSYKIWQSKAANIGEYEFVEIPRIGSKSGKLMMLHGYKPEYAGQGRGYARLGFAIQEMENLTDFTSAAIKKAINQSNLVLSIENQQKDPGNPFEGITLPNHSAIGAQVQVIDESSQEIINRLSTPQVCPIPEASLDTPGGVSFVGNEQGDHVALLETRAPADNFKEFITVFTERLAAAMGIPWEVVLMKFSNNYSASRATLILFWRIIQLWREEMAYDFLNPIYESWLSEEIAAGRISAPGWSDPRMRAAWLNCTWIGAPMPSIDPDKEAKARKQNLEMNLTTLDRESRNYNGSDVMTNIEKNRKTFDDLPVPPWSKNPAIENSSEESEPEEKSEDIEGDDV
jgi:lambda family phage portal protein